MLLPRYRAASLSILLLLLSASLFAQEDLTRGSMASVPPPAFRIRYYHVLISGSAQYFVTDFPAPSDERLKGGQAYGGEAGADWGYHHFAFGFAVGGAFGSDPSYSDGAEGMFQTTAYSALAKIGWITRHERSNSWMRGVLGLSSVRYNHPAYRDVDDSAVATTVPMIGFEYQWSRKLLLGGMRVEYAYPFLLEDRFRTLRRHQLSLSLQLGLMF